MVIASGLVGLKEMTLQGSVQQSEATGVLQACSACLHTAHRALFCPRYRSHTPKDVQAWHD